MTGGKSHARPESGCWVGLEREAWEEGGAAGAENNPLGLWAVGCLIADLIFISLSILSNKFNKIDKIIVIYKIFLYE